MRQNIPEKEIAKANTELDKVDMGTQAADLNEDLKADNLKAKPAIDSRRKSLGKENLKIDGDLNKLKKHKDAAKIEDKDKQSNFHSEKKAYVKSEGKPEINQAAKTKSVPKNKEDLEKKRPASGLVDKKSEEKKLHKEKPAIKEIKPELTEAKSEDKQNLLKDKESFKALETNKNISSSIQEDKKDLSKSEVKPIEEKVEIKKPAHKKNDAFANNLKSDLKSDLKADRHLAESKENNSAAVNNLNGGEIKHDKKTEKLEKAENKSEIKSHSKIESKEAKDLKTDSKKLQLPKEKLPLRRQKSVKIIKKPILPVDVHYKNVSKDDQAIAKKSENLSIDKELINGKKEAVEISAPKKTIHSANKAEPIKSDKIVEKADKAEKKLAATMDRRKSLTVKPSKLAKKLGLDSSNNKANSNTDEKRVLTEAKSPFEKMANKSTDKSSEKSQDKNEKSVRKSLNFNSNKKRIDIIDKENVAPKENLLKKSVPEMKKLKESLVKKDNSIEPKISHPKKRNATIAGHV